MTRLLPLRYFLASVLLLSVLVALVAVVSARRTRQELTRQLEEKGQALAEAVEVASRSAIRGNALMEEMIAQRLLDNARLIDRLLADHWLDPEALAHIRETNRLRRIDLLDREGHPYVPPPPPPPSRLPMRHRPGAMMRGPGSGPEVPEADPAEGRARLREMHREMMMFMWGRRWARPPEPEPAPGPAPIRDRRFWEGSLFGVAVGARSFPGIIAVHADAAYVLNFRKEIGVERQIEELGRQGGVEAVGLLSPERTVLAHSDPRRVGERDADPLVDEALRAGGGLTRLARRPDGREVLAIVRAVALDGAPLGLLRIDLSTEPMRRAWERDLRLAVAMGLSVLLAGGLGMAVIFYGQSRHLREVRALEAEVDRRERLAALGNLAAVVGHEVRNPLNAISMGLQRLRDEFQPAVAGPEYARLLELTQGEVKRLNGIVEEFLSLARPLPLRPTPVAPADLLEEVATLVEPEARAGGVRLDRAVPADLPPVPLDRDHVKQVLLNLLRNGLEAMPGGGTLTLAATAAPDELVVAVEDTGEGIPADLLPRIFEPYVTSKTRGLGLGLAIARRIVEAHGGRLTVESRAGRGSRFTVWLPRAGGRPGG